MSSANRRLFTSNPWTQMPPVNSWTFLLPISSRKTLKRFGDKTHPCLTPTLHKNFSLNLVPILTLFVDFALSCSSALIMLSSIPHFLNTAHIASCHTLSNAFLWWRIQEYFWAVFLVLFAQYSGIGHLLRCTSSCSKTCLIIIQHRLHSWCNSLCKDL